MLISPLLAFAAVSYWTEVEGKRWKGTILAIACIGLMCDGMGKPIYLATDVWLKPLIVFAGEPAAAPNAGKVGNLLEIIDLKKSKPPLSVAIPLAFLPLELGL